MALLGSKDLTQSNVIAYETLAEFGACREVLTFDNSTAQLGLGGVLISNDDGATWAALADTDLPDAPTTEGLIDAAAATATRIAIIIGSGDDGSDQVGTGASEDVLCIVKGVCGVRKEFLSYTGTVTTATTDLLIRLMHHVMPLVNVEDSLTKN